MPYFLYSEDDLDDLDILKEIMHGVDEALEMLSFPNGKALVEYLKQLDAITNPPDFIVLDLNTPVWNGLRTLEVLKNCPVYSQVPVIIFSTSRNTGYIEQALKLGAAAYLVKPGNNIEMDLSLKTFKKLCRPV